MSNTILSIQGINKHFGTNHVLKGIDLDLKRGEFFTLLGSSGCGKTTLLRILAGLEQPDTGHLLLNGVDITEVSPDKRNINTVFQNYALFPYMNVFNNIAYGLKIRKVNKQEIKERVTEMLDVIQLPGFEQRMPNQLSGGQKQRIATARALINKPDILLLDEPLGALDLKLRKQMQSSLKELQQKLGITFVYVTHDQEEALNMSDRIGVMNHGVFEQIGTPEEIYNNPRTRFVADFIGDTNLLDAQVLEARHQGFYHLHLNDTKVAARSDLTLQAGETVSISIRPEKIHLYDALPENTAEKAFYLKGTVEQNYFVGAMIRTSIQLSDGRKLVVSNGQNTEQLPQPGSIVWLTWRPQDAIAVIANQTTEETAASQETTDAKRGHVA